MINFSSLLGAITLSILVGCSGKIINQAVAPIECLSGTCEGILYYRQEIVTTTYIQDKILGKDNSLTHYAGASDQTKKCLPVQIEEQTLTSAAQPSRIFYDPGFLETSKFSVSLNANGFLASVGADSTPGAKMAADVLASFASSASILKDKNILSSKTPDIFSSDLPLCNSGKIPVSVTKNRPVASPTKPGSNPESCKESYVGDCI